MPILAGDMTKIKYMKYFYIELVSKLSNKNYDLKNNLYVVKKFSSDPRDKNILPQTIFT